MARRRTSFVEDIFDLLVQMPWWAGIFAAVFFLSLGAVFSGAVAEDQTLSFVASIMRLFLFLLAIVSLLAALASAAKSIRRRTLLNQTRGMEAIRALSWRQFEQLVGEAYRRRGHEVRETGGGGADGGVDLVLSGKNGTALVQCKQWKARQVGVDKVRELFGVVMSEVAGRGILVTSGHFTKDAQAFAAGKPLELVDGPELLRLVDTVQRSPSALGAEPYSPPALSPDCPGCGSPMVLRTAKRGRDVGSQFYGCTRYPACKGTRSL